MRFVALCLLAACASPRPDVITARQVPAAVAGDVASVATADLFVQDAIHKATLTVDEQGAEATAATGISVGTDSGESTPPSLVVDHSFALAIYDQVTGSVLFIGRVSDPSQTM